MRPVQLVLAETAHRDAAAYEHLQARLTDCRLCLQHGHSIFPRAVYAGAITARMMVIGQAPGITEKDSGRPFHAGSGTRLFQWLAHAGIAEDWFRGTQYMTSVTKCYPGRSRSGSGDRVPGREEQALCQPHLETEMAIVRPEVILAVGRLAIARFYPDAPPLETIVGEQSWWKFAWIIPLPHPSGASRWHQIESNRARIARAMQLLAGHVQRLYPHGTGGALAS